MIRIYLFIVFALCCSSCNNEVTKTTEGISKKTQNFDWLLGDWQRTNEKEDRQTYESWVKKNEFFYKGTGYTLKDQDTIWKENITLSKINQAWSFDVLGKDQSTPVSFKLIALDKNSFTCQNLENEFPKKIKYFKNKNNFSAIISGGDMNISFEFKKIQ